MLSVLSICLCEHLVNSWGPTDLTSELCNMAQFLLARQFSRERWQWAPTDVDSGMTKQVLWNSIPRELEWIICTSSSPEEVRGRRVGRRDERGRNSEEVIIPRVPLTHEASINSSNHFNNFMKQASLSLVHEWINCYFFWEADWKQEVAWLEFEPVLVWYLSDFLD